MSRLRFAFVVACLGSCLAMPPAYSQDSLVGTYKGAYVVHLNPRMDASMELVIASVEGRLVKGKATVYNGRCLGTYLMQGVFEKNELRMKATDGPADGPCKGWGFRASPEGKGLKGTVGSMELNLFR